MEPRKALLQRLDDIRAAIARLDQDDFARRYQLQKAADEVRSALSELADSNEVTAEWEALQVQRLQLGGRAQVFEKRAALRGGL